MSILSRGLLHQSETGGGLGGAPPFPVFGGGGGPTGIQATWIEQVNNAFPDLSTLISAHDFVVTDPNTNQLFDVTLGPPGNVPAGTADLSAFTARDLINLIKIGGFALILINLIKNQIGHFLPETGGGQTSSGASVTVINNNLNTVNVQTQDIASAVQSGIRDSIAATANVASNITDSITGGITSLVNGLGTWETNAAGGIAGVLDGAINSLFNPTSALQQGIGDSFNAINTLLNGINGTIVGGLSDDINKLSVTFNAFPATLTQGIETALKGIGGILGPIISAIPGIGDKIAHTIEVLTSKLPGHADSTLHSGQLSDILAQIAGTMESIAGVSSETMKVVYEPGDKLSGGCSYADAIKKLKSLSSMAAEIPQWAKDAIDSGIALVVQILQSMDFFEQLDALAKEEQNKACPITKLSPAQVIEAGRRGILASADGNHELALLGYHESRIKVMHDLAAHQEDPTEALDWWWRGIVTDDDLAKILTENGYSPTQIDAAKTASFRITTLEDAATAYNRETIDEDQLDTILTANHLDSSQILLFKALLLRPNTPQEALQGRETRRALGLFSLLGVTDFDNPPDWFTTAAKSAGLNDTATTVLWWGHYRLGDFASWIPAYFRGRRTYPELVSFAEAVGVPETIVGDLVAVARPLIPFRTIPTMLAAGILTVDEAKTRLSQHGFEQADIDLLIKYAQRSSKTSNTVAAASRHIISLGAAKTLYEDGAITEDQYRAILAEHGLEQAAIDLDVELAKIEEQTKSRRAAGQQVVDEFKAGQIDQPTALQALTQAGLTGPEQAKWAKQLRAARTAAAKLPGEAELRAMVKANVIQQSDYTATLVMIGYSQVWADRFTQLHFAPA